MSSASYLSPFLSSKNWFLTKDHKRIAILYALSISCLFVVGAIAALLVRLNLLTPRSELVSPDTYNRLFTIHGVVMVWFFLIPSIPATLGNFLLPLMIGAKDVAFPRLNLASWYIYIVGAIFTLIVVVLGGLDTGWTFYTPYSTMYSNGYVVLAISGIFIVGFSSIATGLNFITTVHTMRTPGLTWMKLPLFVWTLYATSIILVLATPILAITLILIAVEKTLHVGIFDPALGGDPLLFQHLFWFYSHPAVYIMILPGMGVVSEIIPCFSKKTLFGYKMVAYSSLAIAVLGFLLWGHHMFVSGQSAFSSMAFSILTFLIGVPSAIKVFNWTATLHKGIITLTAPMLYALGFIALFTIGGLTGFFVAALAVDVHLTDTYFVVAHFHYIMVGGMLMAYLGGLHFWWPKITGKMYSEKLARYAVIALFIGFNLTFFPQFILGYRGMPRRYATYPETYQGLHILSTVGTLFLAIGYLLPVIYFTMSLFKEEAAGSNPWSAAGLEWQTSSPPPADNFATPPIVTKPYNYDEMKVLT